MTQSAWPFSGQTVSEAQFRAWARQAFGSRVYQGLSVATSTTGRQLTVTAGLAVVDGCAFMSDSTVTLDVDANTTGLARRVYAVLRLDPQATPRIQLVAVNGPAGGGEASFTQTDTGVYELPLAYATVTAGQAGGWSSSTSGATMLVQPVDPTNGPAPRMATVTHGVLAHVIQPGVEWRFPGEFTVPFTKAPNVWAMATTPGLVCAIRNVTTKGYLLTVKSSADMSANEYVTVFAYGS